MLQKKNRLIVLGAASLGIFILAGLAGINARGPLNRLEQIEKLFRDPPARTQPISNSSVEMRVSRLEMDVFRLESAVRWLANDTDKMERDLLALEARVAALEAKN